jgi:hypothetical protein
VFVGSSSLVRLRQGESERKAGGLQIFTLICIVNLISPCAALAYRRIRFISSSRLDDPNV